MQIWGFLLICTIGISVRMTRHTHRASDWTVDFELRLATLPSGAMNTYTETQSLVYTLYMHVQYQVTWGTDLHCCMDCILCMQASICLLFQSHDIEQSVINFSQHTINSFAHGYMYMYLWTLTFSPTKPISHISLSITGKYAHINNEALIKPCMLKLT